MPTGSTILSITGSTCSCRAISCSVVPKRAQSGTASGTNIFVKKKPVYLKNPSTSRFAATENATPRRLARGSSVRSIQQAAAWFSKAEASSIRANFQLQYP